MGRSGLGSSGWLKIRAIGGFSTLLSKTIEYHMVQETLLAKDLVAFQGLCFMTYVNFLSPAEFLEHFNVMSVNLPENIYMLVFLSLRMYEVQVAQRMHIYFVILVCHFILCFVIMKERKDSSYAQLVQPVSCITLWATSGVAIALGLNIVQLDPALVEWLILYALN
jgi:hypothetical protein